MKEIYVFMKDEYLQRRLIYNLIVLAVLCLCSMITQYMSFVLFAFCLVILGFSTEEEGFCYLGFLLPFCNVVRICDIQFIHIALVALYTMFLTIKMLIKKEFKIKLPIIILILLLIIEMLLPIGAYDGLKFEFIGIILLSFLLPAVIWQKRDKINLKKFLYVSFIALIVSVVISFFVGFIPNANQFIEVYYADGGRRFSALFNNPNILSQYCVFLTTLFMCYLTYAQKKYLPALCLVIITFIGLYTRSKSFYLLTSLNIVVVGVLIYRYLVDLKTSKGKLALYVIGCIAALALCVALFSTRIDFSQLFDLSALTTGRTEIWINALKEVVSTPLSLLFGLGLATRVEWSEGLYAAHSSFIEIIYKLGIVGGLLILAILVIAVVYMLKTKKRKLKFISVYPLLIILLYSCFETTISIYAILIISISLLVLDDNVFIKEEQKIINKN